MTRDPGGCGLYIFEPHWHTHRQGEGVECRVSSGVRMKLPVNALLVDTQGAELTVSTSAPKFVSPMKAQPPLSTVQRPPGAVPVPSPGESPQTAVMLLLAGLGYLVIGLTVVAFTFFFCYSVVWVGYNYGVSA